jgi:hypothetical protein
MPSLPVPLRVPNPAITRPRAGQRNSVVSPDFCPEMLPVVSALSAGSAAGA